MASEDSKFTTNYFEDWVVDNWYGKDLQDNNSFHYAYVSDMPDIRQILRESNFYKASDQIEERKAPHSQGKERAADRMNIRS